MAHNWPGNVRELRNMLARIMLFQASDVLTPPPEPEPRPDAPSDMRLDIPYHAAKEAILSDFDRRYAAMQLQAHGGNVSSAARAMGVSRQFLHKLIALYGLR